MNVVISNKRSLKMAARVWMNQVIHQVLKWLLLVFTFHETVHGKDMGPSYTNKDQYCSSDGQCSTSVGEICWWFYDGCTHGRCMCDPRSHFLDSSGKCRKVKYGGESCYSGDRCPRRMMCKHGKCQCSGSRDMTMTDDGRFCLRKTERLLGESCNSYTNKCFHPTGYEAQMVDCIDGICRCKPGYKQQGGKCRRLNISEYSCTRDHHCQGGALCVEKTCICPNGYVPVAGNSKCAKQGAIYDLGLGAHCDEMNERKYCAQGLVCHQCPSQDVSTCVIYKESHTYNSALVGSGVDRKATIICIVLGLVGALLFLLISSP